MQNSLAYATRVRTIKNDVTKMEASKEMLRLKRQVCLHSEQRSHLTVQWDRDCVARQGLPGAEHWTAAAPAAADR